MRSAILAFIFTLGAVPVAEAGAWLREQGTAFVSTSASTNESRDFSGSAYAEYGLRENITLGFDGSYGFELTGTEEGSGIVFLRFPIGPTDQTHRFAWHFGVGARYLNLEYYEAAELGASWGRGIKAGDLWGWASLDTSVNSSRSPIETRYKLDGTLGLTLNDRVKVMAQAFNTFQGGETFSKIAPSLLVRIGKSRTTFQFSAEIPAEGGGETFYKIGIWSEF